MVDVIREWKPRFVPKQVITEIVGLCQTYGVSQVHGDNFGGGLHQEDWRGLPVAYQVWKGTTSENYLAALSSFLAKRVRLLDNMTARNQLTSLERRPGAGDRESVDHPKHAGAHDDVAAAICGAIVMAQRAARLAGPNIHMPIFAGSPRNIPGQSYGVGASEMPLPSAAPAAVPAYDYNTQSDWKNYVLPDGNISSAPFGGSKKWWGPV